MSARTSKSEEKPCGIFSDLLDEIAECDHIPGPLGQTATFNGNQLIQNDVQLIGVVSQRLQRGFQAKSVAVMIGPPDIDQAIKSAAEFFDVIGDIGGEVGGGLVGFLENAVFLVSKICGAEPQRAVFFVAEIFFPQQLVE